MKRILFISLLLIYTKSSLVAQVKVLVSSNFKPVKEVDVKFIGQKTYLSQTDSVGRIQLTGIEFGTYLVSVVSNEFFLFEELFQIDSNNLQLHIELTEKSNSLDEHAKNPKTLVL